MAAMPVNVGINFRLQICFLLYRRLDFAVKRIFGNPPRNRKSHLGRMPFSVCHHDGIIGADFVLFDVGAQVTAINKTTVAVSLRPAKGGLLGL
jgi:hypothetical protein